MPESIQLSKKVLLLGDPSVGKTSLIRKFVYNMFDDKYISTLGTKVSSKRLIFRHPAQNIMFELKLMIWDVMGQKEYQMIHHSAYQGAQGALIVCDVTRRNTFDNLPNWITELFDVTSQIPIVLIGNKIDLNNQIEVQNSDLEEVANTFAVPSILASAKSGDNVEKAFSTLGENIVKVDYDF